MHQINDFLVMLDAYIGGHHVLFFIASFTDTTIISSLSYITIALMTVPNLIGLWILRKEIKSTIAMYWLIFQ
jgi:AGCS family alanine or glycine:cation symporter